MSYSDLLRSMIEESNLSFKELAEKCKLLGKTIDPSYISKLVNGKIPPPSDEVSTIISKACGKSEDKLVIEGYLDKAPKILIDFINKVRIYSKGNVLIDENNQANKTNLNIIDSTLKNQLLSEFILDFRGLDIHTSSNGIPMNDDSMEPLIPKGSELIISKIDGLKQKIITGFKPKEDKETMNILDEIMTDTVGFLSYKNGDIVAAWDINQNKLLVRAYQYLGDADYVLMPLNRYYAPSFHDLTNTCFNVANIENRKVVINEKAMNVINKQSEEEINGKKVLYKKFDFFDICIIGKVEKVITQIK